MRFHRFATAVLISALTLSMTAQRRVPKDLSNVRGFNYQSAETIGHAEFWLQYNPAVTKRDLDYAKRLQLEPGPGIRPLRRLGEKQRGIEKESAPLCTCRTRTRHRRHADHAVQVRGMEEPDRLV